MKVKRFVAQFLSVVGCVLLLHFTPSVARLASAQLTNPPQRAIATSPEQTAQRLYEDGQFSQAVRVLEAAIADYAARGKLRGQILALRNLALVHLKTRDLAPAKQAIAQSFNLAETLAVGAEKQRLLAQILEVEGQAKFASGDEAGALTSWTAAADAYGELEDLDGALRNQINQVQALQAVGLYNQAGKKLQAIAADLARQPDTLLKVKALQSLGDVLRVAGKLADEGTEQGSQSVLLASLALAEKLQDPAAIASVLMSLGNTARLGSEENASENALRYYRQAAAASPTPELKIQAQLNELNLLIARQRQTEALALVELIQSNLGGLAPNRQAAYARINFAQNLMQLPPDSLTPLLSQTQLAEILAGGVRTARQLGDRRAEAYALGSLGQLYQQNQRSSAAKQATEQALALTGAIAAPDIAYQWQWQLAEIEQTQGNRQGAIAAYSRAVSNLQAIRSDLIAVSSDVQFSFRESVEPLYRNFVDLLLQSQPSQQDLIRARNAIEALQLAELDNFFREACTDANPKQIDQIDARTAVFYSIILRDRVATILALPGQPLRHYSSFVPQQEVKTNIALLRRAIALGSFSDRESRDRAIEAARANTPNPTRAIVSVRERDTDPDAPNLRWQDTAQNLYNWLIAPAEHQLQQSGVPTLVFVLDGTLRNLPIAALKNGDRYLVEDYALAISPGLQLLDPKPIPRQQLSVLAAGLSQARSGFSALPNVELELEDIQTTLPSELLFNQDFTEANFSQLTRSSPAPIVHLATHGQFSSNPENTFILTWDDRINPNELKTLLKADPRQNQPIELLVLSACQTAKGDSRAALGLAGVAVRAGARSTLASLWSVSDEATARLMTDFYQAFASAEVTKAEALRQAQLKLLAQPQFSDPFFWAAFVLVGNWL